MPNVMAALPKYRWRPLFDAAKFADAHYWSAVHAVTLPRRETRWNLQGCSKQISAASGPKFTILSTHVEEVLLFDNFFRLSIYALIAKISSDKVVRWCPCGAFLAIIGGPAFPTSHVQHISNMHSKFALRPHHAWKYGRHPISDRWD